jgi:hypothetical protein
MPQDQQGGVGVAAGRRRQTVAPEPPVKQEHVCRTGQLGGIGCWALVQEAYDALANLPLLVVARAGVCDSLPRLCSDCSLVHFFLPLLTHCFSPVYSCLTCSRGWVARPLLQSGVACSTQASPPPLPPGATRPGLLLSRANHATALLPATRAPSKGRPVWGTTATQTACMEVSFVSSDSVGQLERQL